MARKNLDSKRTLVSSVQKVEHAINRHSHKVTGTERFSAWMNRGSKLKIVISQVVSEQMGKYLRMMNMPSKEQIDQLGERLDALEESLEGLRRLMARAESEGQHPEPRRSRKPPADPV
jgi:hypothetical protein